MGFTWVPTGINSMSTMDMRCGRVQELRVWHLGQNVPAAWSQRRSVSAHPWVLRGRSVTAEWLALEWAAFSGAEPPDGSLPQQVVGAPLALPVLAQVFGPAPGFGVGSCGFGWVLPNVMPAWMARVGVAGQVLRSGFCVWEQDSCAGEPVKKHGKMKIKLSNSRP